jgi:hypothetical protein
MGKNKNTIDAIFSWGIFRIFPESRKLLNERASPRKEGAAGGLGQLSRDLFGICGN